MAPAKNRKFTAGWHFEKASILILQIKSRGSITTAAAVFLRLQTFRP
jgi:hypothetical protein